MTKFEQFVVKALFLGTIGLSVLALVYILYKVFM